MKKIFIVMFGTFMTSGWSMLATCSFSRSNIFIQLANCFTPNNTVRECIVKLIDSGTPGYTVQKRIVEMTSAGVACWLYNNAVDTTNRRLNAVIGVIANEYQVNKSRREEFDEYISELKKISVEYNNKLKVSFATSIITPAFISAISPNFPTMNVASASLISSLSDLATFNKTVKMVDWKVRYQGGNLVDRRVLEKLKTEKKEDKWAAIFSWLKSFFN